MKIIGAMIVKNEQRDLPRALESFGHICDGFVIVDTGSTDDTVEIAKAHPKVLSCKPYYGASEYGEDGDWKIFDFAKARNVAVSRAEILGADWVVWIDADDELQKIAPQTFRELFVENDADAEVVAFKIKSAGMTWTQHRAWKAGLGIKFGGAGNEYPTHG